MLKETAVAALKVAVDLVAEGLIDEKEAMLRVDAEQLNQLLHPDFDKKKLKEAKVITKAFQHLQELQQVNLFSLQKEHRS